MIRTITIAAALLLSCPAMAQMQWYLPGASPFASAPSIAYTMSGDCHGQAGAGGQMTIGCRPPASALGSSQILARNLPGAAPGAGTFTLGMTTAVPGDFSFTCDVGSCVGHYYQYGNLAIVSGEIAGTVHFTTASGTVSITGMPFDGVVVNQALLVNQMTNFTNWATLISRWIGRLSTDNSVTFNASRKNLSPANLNTTYFNNGDHVVMRFNGPYWISGPLIDPDDG